MISAGNEESSRALKTNILREVKRTDGARPRGEFYTSSRYRFSGAEYRIRAEGRNVKVIQLRLQDANSL